MTNILFVLNAVVVIVHLIVSVMNVCRGPWRKWSLTLNYVSCLLVKAKRNQPALLRLHLLPDHTPPSVDIDKQIRAHIATFSWDVDDRLASMSSSIMTRLDELFSQFRSNVSNRSLPAEPEVSGLTPPTGQSPPLCRSVSTHVNPMRFQSDVGGPVPQSSGSAQDHGEFVQLGSSQGLAPRPHASLEDTEPAHAVQSARGNSGRLATSSDHPVFMREPEDEDEDGLESVHDFPVDKTFNHLVNFIYE